MYRFSDFPPQTIRDSVTEVLSTYGTPLETTEIAEHVFEILEINEPVFSEHQIAIQTIIDDMILAGRLKRQDKSYVLGDIRKDGNEETYHVKTLESPSESPVLLKGSRIVNTIGNQYYTEAWDKIDSNIVFVELIPEPQNPYDRTAVAVTINNELVGHLTRSVANEYFNSIVKLNQTGYSLQVEGEILEAPNDKNYRFIQLAMPTKATIENYLA